MRSIEAYIKEEKTYRTHNRRAPLEHVIAGRTSAAGGGRVTAEVNQLLCGSSAAVATSTNQCTYLVNALESHGWGGSCEEKKCAVWRTVAEGEMWSGVVKGEGRKYRRSVIWLPNTFYT
jgi:hypothetical protein